MIYYLKNKKILKKVKPIKHAYLGPDVNLDIVEKKAELLYKQIKRYK